MSNDATASLTITDRGFSLSGDLVFLTVQPLLEQSLALLEGFQGQDVVIDCAATGKMDSAGIALLMEWKRWCYRHKKTCHFQNLPDQARSLIEATGVDSILLEPA